MRALVVYGLSKQWSVYEGSSGLWFVKAVECI